MVGVIARAGLRNVWSELAKTELQPAMSERLNERAA